MRDPSVQDMDSLDTRLDRVDAVLKLRQHSAAGVAAPEELLCLRNRHLRDQRGGILRVLIDALDIRQKYQFLRLHRFRNRTGGIVRIYIVGIITVIRSNRAYNRYKIIVQKGIEKGRVDLRYFPT